MASSDSGEPRESGGSLASRPGFFFFRARQGHPLPALHALNSCAGTDLPVFTQKDITRRWAPSTQSRSLGQAPNMSFPATASRERSRPSRSRPSRMSLRSRSSAAVARGARCRSPSSPWPWRGASLCRRPCRRRGRLHQHVQRRTEAKRYRHGDDVAAQHDAAASCFAQRRCPPGGKPSRARPQPLRRGSLQGGHRHRMGNAQRAPLGLGTAAFGFEACLLGDRKHAGHHYLGALGSPTSGGCCCLVA